MAEDKMQQDEPANGQAQAKEPAPAGPEKRSPADVLTSIVALLEKSVKMKETSLGGRVLRQTATIRKQLNIEVLKTFVEKTLSNELESKSFLSAQLSQVAASDSAMQTEDVQPTTTSGQPAESSTPEVELYSFLVVLMYTVDKADFERAKAIASYALDRLKAFNRRTLDIIAARIYFYYSLSYEKSGSLADIRSTLLALHRTAVLHHDSIGQETLMVLLLRNYLHYSLYDQAEKFRSKAQKADLFRSNTQYCRYLYYLGRIRCVQLEYSEAKEYLQQASRKAPASALGFRVAVDKWLTLVRLLLGEVPDRQELVAPGLRGPLQPYYQLVQAVRSGQLAAFGEVAARHAGVFRADRTHNLITRLHQNVIRTGLRRINAAYSRISLADVAAKLHLPSVEDAEYIVAKAIRDGGIEATLDHEGGFMASKELVDVYSTAEPQEAFHARIAFCLDVHNEAVKAMRFEPDAHKKRLESADARKERLAQEAELAQSIAEDDDMGDDF